MNTPKIWGPSRWRIFHNSTKNYPDNPTKADMARVDNYFNRIFETKIPCGSCKASYIRFKSILQVKYYLQSRKQLMFWGFLFHNLVNEKLGKPMFTYDQFVQLYY